VRARVARSSGEDVAGDTSWTKGINVSAESATPQASPSAVMAVRRSANLRRSGSRQGSARPSSFLDHRAAIRTAANAAVAIMH
jgi:hypothetical protein